MAIELPPRCGFANIQILAEDDRLFGVFHRVDLPCFRAATAGALVTGQQ